jgi:hypothetical protein
MLAQVEADLAIAGPSTRGAFRWWAELIRRLLPPRSPFAVT